ncbi:hypothetical protein BDZ85DRAFT_135836 [Elsinoe ampelina]|uniref:Uncharacterized protein n=1 Tax=Elsinoe ampelina TaxID=302913 RepID=A0A6A6G9G2_9PEZI|nr:hypothetical protein BDZ85DRAFT_135836 [Elsinoe ampelina]
MHALTLLSAKHLDRVQLAAARANPGATATPSRRLDIHSPRHTLPLPVVRVTAMSTIRSAASTTAMVWSDHLVASIVLLAHYEALFRDPNVYGIHMEGLQRLVEERSGLGRLGVEGILEKMILWIDSNAGLRTLKGRYFSREAFPSAQAHPAPAFGGFGNTKYLITSSGG